MSQTSSPTTVPGITAPAGGAGVDFGFGQVATNTPTVSSTTPLISQDQSSLTQYVLQKTGGYPVTIGNIPGGPTDTAPTTIGQALQEFWDLPPNQLMQLQTMLFDAGYYVDGNGQPMQAGSIVFGTHDSQSWTAFARALEAAASSNTPLATVLQNNINSGAGAAARATLPQAVQGGGNTYTIDLSNPEDVRYAADQIFQAALGRNANDSEVTDITSKLRSQETAQGVAKEQGAEQSSQARYQASVAQRNTAYQFQTTPRYANGAIPSGPFNSATDWSAALLGFMGMPVTASNVAAVAAWVQRSGKFGDGSYNPLGTSNPEGGSQTKGGTQDFQNWAQGIEATASELNSGKFNNVITALQSGNAAAAFASDKATTQELSSWSDGKYGAVSTDQSTTQAAAQSAQAWQAQQGSPSTPSYRGVMGVSRNNLNTLGAPTAGVNVPSTPGAPSSYPSTNYADINQGQQPPNPGDTYVNPVTVYSVNPASESAAAYQEATTGANRIPYEGNTYLNAYQSILAMIKAGGPTA